MNPLPPTNADASDAELILSFATSRCEDSFRSLIMRHSSMVRATALRSCGNETQADEICQSVFVILAQKAAKLDVIGSLGPWLHRVTVFEARAANRREIRQEKIKSAMKQNVINLAKDTEMEAEAAPLLDEALMSLPKRDQALVVLRYFEKLSYSAAGEALGGKSADAVRMQLQRALQRLAEFFKRRGIVCSAAALGGMLANVTPSSASPSLMDKCLRAGLAAPSASVGFMAHAMGRWHWLAAAGVFVVSQGLGVLVLGEKHVPADSFQNLTEQKRQDSTRFAHPSFQQSASQRLRAALGLLRCDHENLQKLAEAIQCVGELQREDFPVLWPAFLERAGPQFDRGNLPQSLLFAFACRWAELQPAEAFAAMEAMPDKHAALLEAYGVWFRRDPVAARAALDEAFPRLQLLGAVMTKSEWMRFAWLDPQNALRLSLLLGPNDNQASLRNHQAWTQWIAPRFPKEMQFHLRELSDGQNYVERGYSIDEIQGYLKSFAKLDLESLKMTLLFYQGWTEERKDKEAGGVFDEIMSRLPKEPWERKLFEDWLNQDTTVSDDTRRRIQDYFSQD